VTNPERRKVLFVCIHNSARSQMAEALLNHLGSDRFTAESAGLEPGVLNPLAVEVLREIGLDIKDKSTRSVFDLFRQGHRYHFVITVCDETSAERCPLFPGYAKRLHWSFPDPSALSGTWAERLAGTRRIRDQIRASIEQWLDDITDCAGSSADGS
jgi:arsenate reductase